MADELDTASAVSRYLGARSSQETVRTSLALASGVNPDEEAEYKRLALRSGIPIDSVRDNKTVVQQQLAQPNAEELARKFPSTTKYLSSLENARIAHDDVSGLTAIERSVRGFIDPSTTTNAYRGAPAVMTGREFSNEVRDLMERQPGLDFDTARKAVLEMTRVDNQTQMVGPSRGPKPTAGNIAAGVLNPEQFRTFDRGLNVAASDILGFDSTNAIRDYERAKARVDLLEPEFKTATGQGLYGGLSSTVRNSPGIALSILSGSAVPGLVAAGVQTGAEAYGKYRSRGGTGGQAAAGALLEGGIEIATELLPMRFVVDRLGKAGATEFIKGLLARELPTEQLATLAQDAVDTAIANPDKTWKQYALERPGAAYQTLLATVVQSGVMGAANTTVTKMAGRDEQVRRAEDAAGRAEEFAALVGASKLRERDPEAFKQFLQQVTQDGQMPAEFYIDAEQLANTLNQSAITMDELRAMAPEVAAQLDAAKLVPGADIRVPMTEFATVPPEVMKPLLDHLREAPDSMSRAEAQAFLKDQGPAIEKEVGDVLNDAEAQTLRKQAADTASKVFEDQLTTAGRFRPEVNKAYATVLGNFYATQAERSGMTVEDFMDRYQLRVVGKEATKPLGKRQQLEQAPQQSRPDPVKQREMIELRKQESVLKSLITCLGAA